MNQQLARLRNLLDKCVDHAHKHDNLIGKIHALATTLGFCHTHQPFASKLLNTYAKLNNPLEAHRVFSQIPNPDIVSWTCLISLYLQIDHPKKAFALFSDLCNGLRPDGFSVVAALTACGRNKDSTNGRLVHGMVYRFELGISEAIVGNALIDMYSRNGRIRDAKMVFDEMPVKDVASWTSLLNGFVLCDDLESAWEVFVEMPQRNVISWTAIIVGFVRGKNPIRGLELFRQMRADVGTESGDQPTAITIVAVLSGCADVGALDFGQSIHGYIRKLVGLATDVAVNNALLDMYFKSGNVDMGVKIFGEMVKKDLFTWSTMICGLALHGRGIYALEIFNDMLESGLIPNEITFLSILSACSHAGLVNDGKRLFDLLIHSYGLQPKIEHYGCMVDLLGRAGCLEEAIELIERMPICPDAVIWRSLFSACLEHKNLELAEMAGKKVLELEPDDDGVYVLLWNIYCSLNKWDGAVKMRKMMRDKRIKKRPGCSWIELNGIVHEFLATNTVHHAHTDLNELLEFITNQSRLTAKLNDYLLPMEDHFEDNEVQQMR